MHTQTYTDTHTHINQTEYTCTSVLYDEIHTEQCYTCTNAHPHTHTHTHTYIHIHAYIDTYIIYTHTHTRIHTFTHTNTYT